MSMARQLQQPGHGHKPGYHQQTDANPLFEEGTAQIRNLRETKEYIEDQAERVGPKLTACERAEMAYAFYLSL